MKRQTGVLFVALFLLFVGWGALARPADAHAVLVAARPSPNTILDDGPARLWILFSEPIVPAFSQVTVLTQAGRPLETGDLQLDNPEGTAVAISLPPLDEGSYLVSWQVLSSVDGHTTSGSFAFGVGVEELAAAVDAVTFTAQITPLGAIGRWLNLTGLALLLGLVLFQLLIWRPLFAGADLDEADRKLNRAFERAGRRTAVLSLLLLLAGLFFTFLSQTLRVNLLSWPNLSTWLATQFGLMWLLRLGLVALAGLGLFILTRRRSFSLTGPLLWPALGAALLLALATALISHSAALPDNTLRGVAVDLIHLVAAGVWVGGLAQLGIALWLARSLPADSRLTLSWNLLLDFSTLAAGAIGLLILSGGYLAWQHVGGWNMLLGTAYGRVLLLKLALAAPALAIAGLNLLVIRPRLDALFERDEDNDRRPLRHFRRLVWAEAGLALLILAAAGLLTDLQRAVDAPMLTGDAGEMVIETRVEDLDVSMRLNPARVGHNRFDIYLADEAGPVSDAGEVSLRFTYLGETIGVSQAEAEAVGDGFYRLEGSNLSLIGAWQVEIAVRRPGAFDVFAPFRLQADLSGQIRPEDQRQIVSQMAASLTRTGNLIPALLLVIFAVVWFFIASRAAAHNWQLVSLMAIGLAAFWWGGAQLFEFYQDFTPARFATNPVLPDADSIAEGQALYDLHCAVCHGPQGWGDGPGAAGLMPPPADFTEGHTDTHPDGDLYYWIREGMPGTAMPGFGQQLDDREIWHLVNYVRRLSAQGP